MKLHDCDQGSIDWMMLRLGIPTASEFHKIVTPKKLELSSQAKPYAYRLIAETLLNRPMDSLENLEWVTRGKELEPHAVKVYEATEEVETRPVGFITTDDGRVGASPDRLIVGKNAGLEIKCPSPQMHIQYMLEGFGDDYRLQVQGQMYVAELDFVDRFSYHPEMPPVPIRTYREEEVIKILRDRLNEFNDMKDELLMKATASGFFAEHAIMRMPQDIELQA